MVLVEDQDLKGSAYTPLLNWITFPILKYNTKSSFVIFFNFGGETWTMASTLHSWRKHIFMGLALICLIS